MQIILIRGPVDQIQKINLGVFTAIQFVVVLLLLLGVFYLWIHRPDNKQITNPSPIDLYLEYGNKDDYILFIKKIQEKLAENEKKLNELEQVNKKLLKLNVPEFALEGNPELKNRINEKTLLRDGKGGPFIKVTEPPNTDLVEVLKAYLNQVNQSNHDLGNEFQKRRSEMSWIASQPIAYPIKDSAHLSSGFGLRLDPFSNFQSMHTGIDFAAPVGTLIHSAAAGKVRQAGWNGSYGMSIEIDHGNGLVTRYAHTSQLLVTLGMVVQQNQPIARVGTTGRSTGPHLHYEVLKDNNFLNPAVMLSGLSK